MKLPGLVREVSELDSSGEWSTDGYGIDSCLVHCATIEQDCPCCPDCGGT